MSYDTPDWIVTTYQAPWSCTTENFGCLKHFYHERTSIPEQIVFCPDPGEELVHDPNDGMLGRYKRSRLRKNGHQCSLSQER